MNIDCVFSGGGIKAFAYIGALEAMEENEFTLERVAGTSAGALVASLVAAGFKPWELRREVEQTNLLELLDPPKWSKFIPLSKWVRIYFKMGMYKGDALENWVFNLLEKKGIRTFGDLQTDFLKIVVSDITLKKLIVIPDDLKRVYGMDKETFPIATAVRMSAGFPYFFMPKKLHYPPDGQSIMVDGGLLSNFPLWVFGHRRHAQKRPILGVRLKGEDHPEHVKPITNALEMFQGLFSTMKLAHDTRYVSIDERKNIIYIPTSNISATDFSSGTDHNEQLIKTGYDITKEFLISWPC